MNHLNIAQHLVTDLELRRRLARLNLALAVRCNRATTFRHALRFACFGIVFLGPPGNPYHRPRSQVSSSPPSAQGSLGTPAKEAAKEAAKEETTSAKPSPAEFVLPRGARRLSGEMEAVSRDAEQEDARSEAGESSISSAATQDTEASSMISDGLLPEDIDYDALYVFCVAMWLLSHLAV